jgi:hypothetical protein
MNSIVCFVKKYHPLFGLTYKLIMKKYSLYLLFLSHFTSMTFDSLCQTRDFETSEIGQINFKNITSSGLKYNHFKSGSAIFANVGDFIKLNLTQLVNDSIIFSNVDSIPLYVRVVSPPKSYDISELFIGLSKYDSVSSLQLMDSFLVSLPKGSLSPDFKAGDKIFTHFKVLDIFLSDSLKTHDEKKETQKYFKSKQQEKILIEEAKLYFKKLVDSIPLKGIKKEFPTLDVCKALFVSNSAEYYFKSINAAFLKNPENFAFRGKVIKIEIYSFAKSDLVYITRSRYVGGGGMYMVKNQIKDSITWYGVRFSNDKGESFSNIFIIKFGNKWMLIPKPWLHLVDDINLVSVQVNEKSISFKEAILNISNLLQSDNLPLLKKYFHVEAFNNYVLFYKTKESRKKSAYLLKGNVINISKSEKMISGYGYQIHFIYTNNRWLITLWDIFSSD